jgi:hypothetical protein
MSEDNEPTEDNDASEPVDFNAEMESLVEGAAGLFDSLKDIFLKSKQEVVRGAKLGKVRIDVFQLRKDREHFLQRLGEEAYELMQSEDIAHDDLSKPFAKLQALDEKIAEYEAEMAKIAEEVAEQAQAAEADLDTWAADQGLAPANEAEAPPEPKAEPAPAAPKAKAKAKAKASKPKKKKTPKKDL